LSLDFAELSLECDEITGFAFVDPPIPTYLKPLLEECGQEECGPHDFSSFIDSFPFDPVLQKAKERHGGELFFKKIGEASYSEVFGIGDVVLKVIPLRDESPDSEGKHVLKARGFIGHENTESEAPLPTDAQDVRKEIIVTRAMGEVHHGFVKLSKTYVVKGKYPQDLLSLWDEYYDDKGSESIRPGTYSPRLCA
jgi:serine/threonine-protein kinase haspin